MRTMKARSGKVKRHAAGAATVACALVLALAGCGGASGAAGGVSDTSQTSAAQVSDGEPIPASQAFASEGVWLWYNKDTIEKDTTVWAVLYFDGNGNVTVYDIDSIFMNGGSTYEPVTFADLDGLSDGEIVSLAKQKSRERFDATKQAAIDETNEDLADGAPEDDYKANAREGQKVNEAAEYQEPQAVPYTLKIETDGTGNNTKGDAEYRIRDAQRQPLLQWLAHWQQPRQVCQRAAVRDEGP